MIGIVTGDIVNSRKAASQQQWLGPLKELLSTFGESPQVWEIYRGDSFQLELKNPEEALMAALRLKACIRSIRGLDIRMAIGIGEKSFDAPRISESNGEAFIRSGEQFEILKPRKKKLALQSPWPEVDLSVNLMLDLASIAMDAWSPAEAKIIAALLQHPQLTQTELGDKLGKKQSTVSETLKRAHCDEIMNVEAYYRKHITQKTHKK